MSISSNQTQGTAAGGGPAPGPPSVTSSSSSAGAGTSIPVVAAATKRNRIRLSCTTCRDKKLKCNRDQPCDQCEKRGIQSTCVYIPYRYPRGPQRTAGPAPRAGRSSGGSNEAVLQEQNRHLKEVVQRLSAELAKRGSRPASSDGGERPRIARDGVDEAEETAGGSPDTIPTGALMNERYIDSANWEAISDDVTKLLDDLKTEDDYEEETYVELEMQQGAALVLGGFIPMTATELFTWLPPPNITTWLMTRFFKGKEPAWLIFHVPTFWKQYHAFWQSPSTFPIAWYALVFVMISHAANFCLRADEDIPGGMGTAQEVSDCWRINCAHCLAIDDYTKPGKFKVETLLLYFGAEYLRVRDAQRGTSILLTIACRLAMHMGLHRDASHYKEISTYEGEMRRRLWTVLTEIDCLVTFQFGTPLNIQSQYCDTKLPSNLRDEDFNEATEVLPMERPLTERTTALYTIVKSRIVTAMADIVARMQSNVSPTYGEVMRLDKKLSDAHDAIPPILRARPFKLSQEDPIDLIMQRLWIELMYLKSRIVLHRRYFTLGRTDLSFRHSTHACMQAATATLEHQLEAHIEIQPGGRLAKEQWFLSSLSIHDFLLADMIVCLEISCILRDHNALGAPLPRDGWDPELRQLLHIIKVSRQIWAQARKESQEANRAYKILGRMMQTAMGATGDPDLELAFEPVDLRAPPSYHFTGAPSSPYHPQQASHVPGPMPSVGTALNTPWAALVPPGPVGTVNWPVVEGPEVYGAEAAYFQAIPQGIAMDWSNWDTQIQNTDAEMLQISWANFFAQELHE